MRKSEQKLNTSSAQSSQKVHVCVGLTLEGGLDGSGGISSVGYFLNRAFSCWFLQL